MEELEYERLNSQFDYVERFGLKSNELVAKILHLSEDARNCDHILMRKIAEYGKFSSVEEMLYAGVKWTTLRRQRALLNEKGLFLPTDEKVAHVRKMELGRQYNRRLKK